MLNQSFINKQSLYNFYQLTLNFVKKDIKLRYTDTLLGSAWIVFKPLSFTAVTTIVFSFIFRSEIDNVPYFLFVLIGFASWLFFSQNINQATRSLIYNRSLVVNTAFSKESLVLSITLTGLVDYLINLIIFFCLLYAFGFYVKFVHLVFFSVTVIAQIFFQLGLSFITSTWNVFYRDVQNMVEFLLQILFFITPVVYPSEIIPQKFRWLLKINPLANIINFQRELLFQQVIHESIIIIVFVFSIAILIVGIMIFRAKRYKFPEQI